MLILVSMIWADLFKDLLSKTICGKPVLSPHLLAYFDWLVFLIPETQWSELKNTNKYLLFVFVCLVLFLIVVLIFDFFSGSSS